MGSLAVTERPTSVVRLDSGVVEYRLERRGDDAVVIFHGGHMRAGLTWGEEVFADAGFTVLVPSRPGYGRTPSQDGVPIAQFADLTCDLCDHLGIRRVAAAVGVSAGGRAAVSMAARRPDLVERLILQSAVSWMEWPDRRTRRVARLVFAAGAERVTWGCLRALLRVSPGAVLRTLLGSMSTLPVEQVMAGLSPQERADLVGAFSLMRSGRGFETDLRSALDPKARVCQPTLVIASPNDGAVPFAHATALASAIERARLVESRADSHLIWLGPDWPEVARTIEVFLSTDPA
jgi:pimeloyl-ACP methyl ester carboxylesterase